MKKILILFFSIVLSTVFFACTDDEKLQKTAISDIKVAFLYKGPLDDYGYAHNHDIARLKLAKALGVDTIGVANVPDDLHDGKIVDTLIAQGFNVIYATSFEHMNAIANAAEKYPNVYFGHATGYIQLANLSNYMGRIYEARFLAGIVAGMNTKSDRIGYVGSMPTPEVFRGINAFALGVKYVNSNAFVEVEWTNSWNNPELEKELSQKLVHRGADIITHHTDNNISQIVANDNNILGIGHNGSNMERFPNSYLTAPLFNWEVFYIDDVSSIINGTWQSRTYYEGLSSNMISLDAINSALVQKDTLQVVEKAKKDLIAKKLNVFTGPLYDDKGQLQVVKGHQMYDEEILSMTFLLDNVIDNLSND